MLWLNLLLLACIAFLPFPTAVLGNHLDLPVAVRLYAASVTVTGLASTLLWWYATGRGRLVDEDLDPRVRRFMLLRALTAPVVFGLSIPLVTVQVPVGAGRISLAFLLWLLLVPAVRLLVRLVVLGDAGPVAADPPAIRGLPGIPRGADGHDRDVGAQSAPTVELLVALTARPGGTAAAGRVAQGRVDWYSGP